MIQGTLKSQSSRAEKSRVHSCGDTATIVQCISRKAAQRGCSRGRSKRQRPVSQRGRLMIDTRSQTLTWISLHNEASCRRMRWIFSSGSSTVQESNETLHPIQVIWSPMEHLDHKIGRLIQRGSIIQWLTCNGAVDVRKPARQSSTWTLRKCFRKIMKCVTL